MNLTTLQCQLILLCVYLDIHFTTCLCVFVGVFTLVIERVGFCLQEQYYNLLGEIGFTDWPWSLDTHARAQTLSHPSAAHLIKSPRRH